MKLGNFIVESKKIGKKRWEKVDCLKETLKEAWNYIENGEGGRAYRIRDLRTNLTSKVTYIGGEE